MGYLQYLILFLIGLSVGSFLNVISLRYQPGQKILDLKIIGGRSRCRTCGVKLKWHELIPLVSFILQKGHCRNCLKPISWQYPLVEVLSGLIFIFITYNLQPATYNIIQLLVISYWLLVFESLLLLSIIDFHWKIIPDQLNLLLAVLGIILIIFPMLTALNFNQFNNSATQQFNNLTIQQYNVSFLGPYALLFDLNKPQIMNKVWLNRLLAAFIGLLFFGLIILLSRGKAMGWGDFKLAGALGLLFGWPDVIIIIALAFMIGAIVSVVLMLIGKKKRKDTVPFGPFLVAGTAMVFLWGQVIMELYFKIVSLY